MKFSRLGAPGAEIPVVHHDGRTYDLRPLTGTRRQSSRTDDMVSTVAGIFRCLSEFMVLEPGDLINTGTPGGVALGRDDHPYLRAGDVVELTIEGLGTAGQTLVQA